MSSRSEFNSLQDSLRKRASCLSTATRLVFCGLGLTLIAAESSSPVEAAEKEIGFIRDRDICPQPRIDVPARLRSASGGDPGLLDTLIEGDEIELLPDNTVILLGNAQILQGRRGVFADRITYNKDSYTATAEGGVTYYTAEGDKVTTDRLQLEVDTFIGDAGRTRFWVADRQPQYTVRKHELFVEDYSVFAPFRLGPRNGLTGRAQEEDDAVRARARASAEKIYFEGHDFERLVDARLTSCPEGNEDVVLTAKELELDHAAGIGTGKHMSVRFKNVPIFYFPRASFPIDDQRKTGFLFPSVGYDEDAGGMFSLPFYWNIAPNYDATFIPRYMDKRGGQLYSEFRYLGHTYEGALRGEYMPDDKLYGEERYAFGYDHDQNISDRWHGLVDLQTVSDNNYLKDFSNNVQVYSATHLPQIGKVDYNGDYVFFEAEAAAFETIDDKVLEENYPYRTLPRTVFDVNPVPLGMFEVGLDSSLTNFDHEDRSKVTGWRLNTNPWLSLPLESVYGYVTPKVSVGYIQDSLDSDDPLEEENPSVTVPRFSLDSTVYFERDTFLLGENMVQTLEPRLFYVYAPFEEQDDLPIFDTGVGDPSSFSYFFRENRFFGGDRYGDANRLTLGLTSRMLAAADGAQRMNFSIGEVFFFEDRQVLVNPSADDEAAENPDLTRSRSDFLAEFDAEIGKDWELNSFFRYDHEENLTRTFRLGTTYDHSARRQLGLVYWYDHEQQEQLELTVNWALSPRWQLQFDNLYSLRDSENRATGINLTYDGCCWAVRLGAFRSLRNDGEFKDGVALTFELDNLGAIRTGF